MIDLPGAGPVLAAAITERFPEPTALAAIAEAGDVSALASVPGVSVKRAIAWIRHLRGETPDLFLGDEGAEAIAESIVERIRALAVTPAARDRLRLLGPKPTPAKAAEHAAYVATLAKRAATIDAKEANHLLSRLAAPKVPPPRRRTDVIVIADEDNRRRLEKAGVDRYVAVDDTSGLERAHEYPLVLLLGDVPDLDVPQALTLQDDAPPHVVAPWEALTWLDANRATIEAAAGLEALIGQVGPATRLAASRPEAVAQPPDAHGAIQAAELDLAARYKAILAGLTVGGDGVLGLLEGRLPPEAKAAMEQARGEARRRLKATLGVDGQPFGPGYPLAIDEEEVTRIGDAISARHARTSYDASVDAASRIVAERDAFVASFGDWIRFDMELALGRSALGMAPARFGPGFLFQQSLHLGLLEHEGRVPISYHAGRDERVVVLTGANSGGKTTLLEHLAQLAILARFGLPVPGTDVEVPWVDSVHLVRPRRGLDAGAFERFLRAFLPLAGDDATRLVLADEVEATTELNAAGHILGYFLDRAAASGSLVFVVSHLHEEILKRSEAAARGQVRVDGIEARGLDDQHRLIVDRTPKIGRAARSTPELIIRRLAATSNGDEAAVYEDLLCRLAPKGQRAAIVSATT